MTCDTIIRCEDCGDQIPALEVQSYSEKITTEDESYLCGECAERYCNDCGGPIVPNVAGLCDDCASIAAQYPRIESTVQ